MFKPLFAVSRPFYNVDDPGGGNSPMDPPTPPEPPIDKSAWTPEQWQAEINRVAADTRRITTDRVTSQISAQQQAEAAAAAAAAAQAEAEARGEYDTLKSGYEATIAAHEDTIAALTAERDALQEQVIEWVTTEIGGLPEALRVLDPGEEAPLTTRMAWLAKAQVASEKMGVPSPVLPGNRPPAQPPSATLRDDVREQVRRATPKRF